jgi:hypothetical protein
LMSRRSGPFSCTKSTPASSQGNLWVGDNFTVGWQAQDTFWQEQGELVWKSAKQRFMAAS